MTLEEMRKEVFRIKPKFADIARMWEDKTLLQYYQQDFSNLHAPSKRILDAIEQETTSILGSVIGKKAHSAMQHMRWVNTADHHGLLHHPYFYITALALSHPSIQKTENVTVTLPFGGISLGNDSFPRGCMFHDRELSPQRIFFKSLKERRLPVYALSPITKRDLQREQHHSLSFSLSKDAHEKLQSFFVALDNNVRVWSQETFSAQLTAMNNVLWHELFAKQRGDFVYLEMETVVRRLLLDRHLVSDTDIFKLLFTPAWQKVFVTLFNDIPYSHTTHSGTHLFWYVDYQAQTRKRLLITNGTLTTPEGDVSINLNPECIAQGLTNRTLMPSSVLSLLIIHAVEKLACGGGASQLQYLPEFMMQWQLLLAEQGAPSQHMPNSAILCGHQALFQNGIDGQVKPSLSTLIDVLLYKKDITTTLDQLLMTTPIAPSVDALIPILHTLFTRQQNLQSFPLDIPSLKIM